MKNSEQPINPMPYQNQDGTIQHDVYFGLTKREYFAAMAMQGIVSNQEFLKNLNAEPDLVVTGILEIADKLLERLSNGDGQ